MSKSKSKDYRRNQWDDDNDDYGVDTRKNANKRREKRIKNLIRSKNVDRLLDMDDDEWDDR